MVVLEPFSLAIVLMWASFGWKGSGGRVLPLGWCGCRGAAQGLLLIMVNVHGLTIKKSEFIGPDNEQYVLKLKKSLYGLKQAPRLWFKTLEKSLHDRGFNSSENDPCLFLKKDLVDFAYVNYVLFFGKTDQLTDKLISSLQKDFKLNVKVRSKHF